MSTPVPRFSLLERAKYWEGRGPWRHTQRRQRWRRRKKKTLMLTTTSIDLSASRLLMESESRSLLTPKAKSRNGSRSSRTSLGARFRPTRFGLKLCWRAWARKCPRKPIKFRASRVSSSFSRASQSRRSRKRDLKLLPRRRLPRSPLRVKLILDFQILNKVTRSRLLRACHRAARPRDCPSERPTTSQLRSPPRSVSALCADRHWHLGRPR